MSMRFNRANDLEENKNLHLFLQDYTNLLEKQPVAIEFLTFTDTLYIEFMI